jgi:hypothetical protein
MSKSELDKFMVEGEKTGKYKKYKSLIVMWVITIVILVSPYGLIHQIFQARARAEIIKGKSTYGKLCYKSKFLFPCNRPATRVASYTIGGKHYFCDKHDPPSRISVDWTNRIWPKEEGPNPWTSSIFFLAIYTIPVFRVIAHVRSDGFWYPSVSRAGATFGLIFAIFFWFKFFMNYRI